MVFDEHCLLGIKFLEGEVLTNVRQKRIWDLTFLGFDLLDVYGTLALLDDGLIWIFTFTFLVLLKISFRILRNSTPCK